MSEKAWPASLQAAHRLLEALIERGLRELVLCPGSRSAPLAYAGHDLAEAGRLRLHMRLDERSAGFWTLGLAKGWLARDGAPILRAAVVTTSGTAVANLHPAVLEASHALVPLLALTADRPAGLRGTGANQTTWQPGLFQQVRRAFDVPAEALDAAAAAALAGAASEAACRGVGPAGPGEWPGPVHLNLCLTEPLAPLPPEAQAVAASADAATGLPSGVQKTVAQWVVPGVPPAEATPWHRMAGLPGGRPVTLAAAPSGRRGVVVAGDGAGARAAEFALACGYPLLAEPSSQARWGNAIAGYVGKLAGALGDAVDEVVVFGHPTLSRPVSWLLARNDVPITVITQGDVWTDVFGSADVVARDIAAPAAPVGEPGWLDAWSDDDERPERSWALRAVGLVTRASARDGVPLLLGSSQVIRRADRVGPCADGPEDEAAVFASRGLAGIDGSIATVQGIALALERPARALLGDLTFWHDIGSLNRGQLEAPVNAQIVAINDRGGSIFGRLEHGQPHLTDYYERLFATPQEGSITRVAKGFAVRAICIAEDDDAGLAAALAAPIDGLSVIEVRADRT